MSALPRGIKINAVYDGKNFIPADVVDLDPGSNVVLEVISPGPLVSAADWWSSLAALRGLAAAPLTFNWDFDRSDLFGDRR